MTHSHTHPALPPGATIGIIGGGQLGRMTALAAARLGYRCHILAAEDNSPASQVSAETTVAPYGDREAVQKFAAAVDVVTLEFENVPLDTLRFLKGLIPLYPGPNALEIAQDRVLEKSFFGTFARTAPWRAIRSLDDLRCALDALGTPAILKTCRLGYDGKGQVKIEKPSDADTALAQVGAPVPDDHPAPFILEGVVAFEREISVIVARTFDGSVASYPVVENVHRNHILHTTTAPASVPDTVADEATQIATTAAERLDIIGLLAVEMFVVNDHVLVNEMAPRPHNSGHWTLDGVRVDQFEQLVRAVCGLPLGDCSLQRPVLMKNLLGKDIDRWQDILRAPAACLHLYGKTRARDGRKMGHVNYLAPGAPLTKGP